MLLMDGQTSSGAQLPPSPIERAGRGLTPHSGLGFLSAPGKKMGRRHGGRHPIEAYANTHASDGGGHQAYGGEDPSLKFIRSKIANTVKVGLNANPDV